MDLSELDKMLADREDRINQRKEEGTLFEEEFTKEESEDERLEAEIEARRKADQERMESQIPDCPQCGEKMQLIPEQSMIACEKCGIGMRI